MNVIVNGDEREVADKSTLTDLLAALSLPSQRIAVEVNREVVRRADWPSRSVTDGDRIEIVHFVGGG